MRAGGVQGTAGGDRASERFHCIDAADAGGEARRMAQGLLDIERVGRLATVQRAGARLVFCAETSSTNDEARRALAQGSAGADGLVIFSDYQTLGRGRFGRVWHAPRGASVLMSTVIVDAERALRPAEVGLAAAVAVQETVRRFTTTRPVIRWPNDVYLRGRKVAGVLVEMFAHGPQGPIYIVGVGINCLQHAGHFPPELAPRATSLELESAAAIEREAVAARLLMELDRWLAGPRRWRYDELRSEWLARAEPMGRRVAVEHGGRRFAGTVIDLDPAAALVLELDGGGRRAFPAAETTLVPAGDDGAPAALPIKP